MITGDEPTRRVEEAIERLVAEVEAASHEVDSDSKLRAILQAELTAQRALTALRKELTIPQPRGFAVSRALRRDLAAYWEEHAALDEEVFKPAIALTEEVVAEATHGLGCNPATALRCRGGRSLADCAADGGGQRAEFRGAIESDARAG